MGSLLDPAEFLGLAHFTEHMLFYSSEKYPVEVRTRNCSKGLHMV